MKNLLLLLFIVSSPFVFCQDTKPGKRALTHLEKPSFYIDLNGNKISGFISFNDYTSKYFMFRATQNDESIKILANTVKSFKYNQSLERITFKKRFYIRRNAQNRIQFYKYFHAKRYVNGDYYTEKGSMAGYYKYFIYMPDKLKLTDFLNKKLRRKFKKTVSKLVKDCPELSRKIKKKVDGYIFKYTNGYNLTLWAKIAKEYETCSLQRKK